VRLRAPNANVTRLPSSSGDARPTPLTRRESEILALISQGLPNAEIARRLWISEQTVKFHLTNIYRKLGVSNRTQASRWADPRPVRASRVS
jgi:DNA-binding CsgD family transcriptional regulator